MTTILNQTNSGLGIVDQTATLARELLLEQQKKKRLEAIIRQQQQQQRRIVATGTGSGVLQRNVLQANAQVQSYVQQPQEQQQDGRCNTARKRKVQNGSANIHSLLMERARASTTNSVHSASQSMSGPRGILKNNGARQQSLNTSSLGPIDASTSRLASLLKLQQRQAAAIGAPSPNSNTTSQLQRVLMGQQRLQEAMAQQQQQQERQQHMNANNNGVDSNAHLIAAAALLVAENNNNHQQLQQRQRERERQQQLQQQRRQQSTRVTAAAVLSGMGPAELAAVAMAATTRGSRSKKRRRLTRPVL